MVKKYFLTLIVLLLALSIAACATGEPFEAGTPLSADDVIAIRDELLEEQSSTTKIPQENNEAEKPPVSTEMTVFWLSNGSVYHTDPNCYHIKEKQGVRAGTVRDANELGKMRVCSSCASD